MTVAADPGVTTLRATRRLLWLLVVPVLGLLGVLTALEYVQRLDDAERDLLRRAGERAQELEAVVRPAMAHVQDLRSLLESRWDDPPDGGSALRRALQRHASADAADGWSLDGADEAAARAFRPGLVGRARRARARRAWLRRAQMFVEQARIVHQRAPGFEATWFAAADVNMSFGYPWVDTGRMLDSMGAASLSSIDVPRRAAVKRSVEMLKRNPDDTVFWGTPYVSQLNGQLVMSHGAMVVVDGRYRGEVSLDFRLDDLQQRVAQWSNPSTGDGARVWIVDARYNVLADSAQPVATPAGSGLAATPVQVPLAQRLPAGLGGTDLDATLFGPERVHRGRGWVLTAAVRIGSPWLYVAATPESALRARVLPTLIPNLLLACALLAMFIAGHAVLSHGFVQPALSILSSLRALSGNAAAPPPHLGERWQGWVDAVTDTVPPPARAAAARAPDRGAEGVDHRPRDERHRLHRHERPHRRVQPGGRGDVRRPPRRRRRARGRRRADPRALRRAANRRELERIGRGEPPRALGRRVQILARRADGREFPVEVVFFRNEVEGAVHFTAWMTDVTERVESAEQIERQREALRQSEKLTAMGSLLAGVAHELNNPLAIVMGRASLLEEKTEGTPLATDAHRIREAAERCGRIVRTFLNMARQRPAARAPVQLNDLARAAAEMLGYTLRSHAIELTLALAGDLPEVLADGDQVGQVLLNLMVNAQQALATVDGPRWIRLQTGLEERRADREPRVWLRVADSGPGVPAELVPKIFEPFFTTKAEGIGTGLGLSVSRSMVREHGGDLVLEKTAAGASFRLSLPVGGDGARDSTASMPLDGAAPAPQARLLVVDDEPEIAELMRSMLESAGLEVATAESGAVALELIDAARFDAIVSDLRMPDMDGAALWRAVRERQPALARRMLFVTGDTLSPEARGFLEKARCPSVDKPFAKGDLLAAVQAVLAA